MNKQLTSQQAAEEIILLFEKYGKEDYDGEPVSQTSHMVQCAMQAIKEGADTELILSGFLHDIGHLLRHEQPTEAMGSFGVVNHEGVGADYLRSKGFSERICATVEKHVDAKRYLVATQPTYQSKLSEASLQTLVWQGGPMNAAEVASFKLNPFLSDIIKVRLWDEKAKDADTTILPLQYFKEMIQNYLSN